MLSDSCNETFKTAYAKIGLNSDTVWIADEPDSFQRANQELWVRHNLVSNLYRNNTDNSQCFSYPRRDKARTVRDTIPFSRLAQYGNYPYNEDREQFYTSDDSSQSQQELSEVKNELPSEQCEEIWMSSEVQEEFKRLTSENSSENFKLWTQQLTPFTPSRQEVTHSEEESSSKRLLFECWASILLTKYPKLATSIGNSQHQSLFSDNTAELNCTEPIDLNRFPTPRYTLQTQAELELHLRINSAEVRDLWNRPSISDFQTRDLHQRTAVHKPYAATTQNSHRPPPPTLNADVPEFYPKTNIEITSSLSDNSESGRKFFPSARDLSHQSELFPYAQINDSISSSIDRNSELERLCYSTASISVASTGIATFTTTMTTEIQQSSSQLHPLRQYAPPSSSILCKPPQRWFNIGLQQQQRQQQQTASHETIRHDSVPRSIPVYQRPPEFYTQYQDSLFSCNGTGSRRRQGGGGVDFSNLILLTRGSKNLQRMQSSGKQVHVKEGQCQHSSSSVSDLLGRDLFSDLPMRTVTHQSREVQNSVSHQEEGRRTEEICVSSDVNITENSALPWLQANYPCRGEELQDVSKLIEEFVSIEIELKQRIVNVNSETETTQETEKTFIEREQFPPISPISTSTPVDLSSQDIERPLASLISPSSSDSGQSSTGVRKRLYRDVLTNSTSPVTPTVSDSGLERRYEELERQALEQYRPSDENLGQRFQQQRTSEESISQRYQELERQAMEQYQSSSSSSSSGSNNGCVGDATGAGVPGRVANPNQPACSGPKHCVPVEDSLLGDDRKLSFPSGGAGPPWTRGGAGGSGVGKRGVEALTCSQSQHDLTGATPLSACSAPTRNKPVSASKSLTAIGLALSPATTKQEATSLRAAGDKGDSALDDASATCRPRLVLITPTKKRQPPPSDVEIEGVAVGPELVVVVPGGRGTGHNMGPGQTQRRLVTAVSDKHQASKSKGSSTRTDGTKSDKSRQAATRNVGGGGDEKPRQRNLANTNPNAQRTQVSAKSVPQPGNISERDPIGSLASAKTTVNTTGCLEIPEPWVRESLSSDSTTKVNAFPLTSEAGNINERNPTRSTASANTAVNSTGCLETPEPWVRASLPSDSTTKVNTFPLTSEAGNISEKDPTGSANSANTAVNITGCLEIPEPWDDDSLPSDSSSKVNTSPLISEAVNISKRDLIGSAVSENTAVNTTGCEAWDHDSLASDSSTKVNTSPITSEVDLERPSTSKLPLWMTRQRKKRPTPGGRKKRTKLTVNKKNNDVNPSRELSSKKWFDCCGKPIDKGIKSIDHFILIHLGNNHLHFKFNNSNFAPRSIIPYDFHINAHPSKCIVDYITNSRAEKVFINNYKIRIKWPKNVWSGTLASEEIVSMYELSAEILRYSSRIKMKLVLKEFQPPIIDKNTYRSDRKPKLFLKARRRLYKSPSSSEHSERFEDTDTKSAVLNQNIHSLNRDLLQESNEFSNSPMDNQDGLLVKCRKPYSDSKLFKRDSPIQRNLKAAFNWAFKKVPYERKTSVLQPERIRKSCSDSSILTQNMYDTRQGQIPPAEDEIIEQDRKEMTNERSEVRLSNLTHLETGSGDLEFMSQTKNYSCTIIDEEEREVQMNSSYSLDRQNIFTDFETYTDYFSSLTQAVNETPQDSPDTFNREKNVAGKTVIVPSTSTKQRKTKREEEGENQNKSKSDMSCSLQ
ncbi:uncharacterized protein [Periplaneta americana]|uniref:uncharacterized protein n=1 Tax=Periplaneta americana TaxID=6978 RepID=UPI0037E8AD69